MKKRNKFIKLLVLVPILLSLTGCTAWWGYNNGGTLDLNILEIMGAAIMNVQLDTFWEINKSLIQLNMMTRAFFSNNMGPWFVVEMLYELMSQFQVLHDIIFIVSMLAVAAIIVKFAYTVFKTYFLNVDGQHAAPTLDFFKRIIYSLIIVLIAPQLIITSFVGSNLIAAAAGTRIINGGNTPTGYGRLDELYVDIETYGLSLRTYCKEGGIDSDGQSSGVGSLKNDISSTTISVLSRDGSSVGGTLKASESDVQNLYGKYCRDGARRVGEYVIVLNDEYVQQWPYSRFGGQNIKASNIITGAITSNVQVLLDGIGGTIAVIGCTFVSLFFIACALFMTAFRIAELVSSVLMLWFYASSYISEVKNNQLGEFVKQIVAICVTQMYTIFIFSIYISFSLSAGSGLMEFFMGFSLLCLMWKGGNTVKNALSSSGAASGTGAVVGVAGKIISKM